MHPMIQKPTSRGFPIARTRWYSACIRNDYYLAADITDLNAFDRTPTFDGGALFCAPEDVVTWMSHDVSSFIFCCSIFVVIIFFYRLFVTGMISDSVC